MCVPEKEKAVVQPQTFTAHYIRANIRGVHEYAEFRAETRMGNISHSSPICTVSTKQQRKTWSSNHVFSFLLLTTTRCTPPLTLPQKTAPRRMCGFWAFDRVKPADLLEGLRRNNPTIQEQACNSSLLGRRKEPVTRPVISWKSVEEDEDGGLNSKTKMHWVTQFVAAATGETRETVQKD